MWDKLPKNEKDEYKKMILAFASLTEMFAQKADDTTIQPSPIINSKYQETVFQKTFNAKAEDIGNTSYDASINKGKNKKYLIGIKTFGIDSGLQKIAQFKANHDEWLDLIETIKKNAVDQNGLPKTKDEINETNLPLYLELARQISNLRNKRIESSEANLNGFLDAQDKENIEAVYHVLMPSSKGDTYPTIYVGEIPYTKINTNKISIIGCTTPKNPTNFEFTDGIHRYRFTSADSQLLMDFRNREIIQERWNVKYADDAYNIFSQLADNVYKTESKIVAENEAYHPSKIYKEESYSWLITNKNGEVEQFSGFNSFYGPGSKLGAEQRRAKINQLKSLYKPSINHEILSPIIKNIEFILLSQMNDYAAKQKRIQLRDETMKLARESNNSAFINDVSKLLYRPYNEMYIPIPDARNFHEKNPDFFGKGIGTFKDNSPKLALPKEKRRFNLIFDPSKDYLPSYITQDNGKAIESADKQSYLGEWILRGIFQLAPYEPLTAKRLKEIGINAIRLCKEEGSTDIHLSFIWIDETNPPFDYVKHR